MTKTNSEPHQFSQLAEAVIADFRRVPLREPERQRKRATKPLADLMEPLLAKYKIGRESAEQQLHAHWAELVGAANASYSHPVEIDARGRARGRPPRTLSPPRTNRSQNPRPARLRRSQTPQY